jgi:hypothetical protein
VLIVGPPFVRFGSDRTDHGPEVRDHGFEVALLQTDAEHTSQVRQQEQLMVPMTSSAPAFKPLSLLLRGSSGLSLAQARNHIPDGPSP